MTGAVSCVFSSVVAVACIDLSYFCANEKPYSHSHRDISICNKRGEWAKKRQKADNFYARKNSSMKCFTQLKG
ncbi:hypothetical protein BME90_25820 [Klebsiella quasipneumoniae subsp. similipneumoniae]|nr:hypothetical protein BME90_25820 [Klebsiella quasipneumoniae subsp. similipneumoniae]OVV22199.1 hypothetical protein BME89_02585 [Klebsiella quasipneumoniae subsp. similipneumoniae]